MDTTVSKRRTARATNVYRTVLASNHDVKRPPIIKRAYRIAYKWSEKSAGIKTVQYTHWRGHMDIFKKKLNISSHAAVILGHLKEVQLVGIERCWIIHPPFEGGGSMSALWHDLLCAQAMRDAMQINHARWLMTHDASPGDVDVRPY